MNGNKRLLRWSMALLAPVSASLLCGCAQEDDLQHHYGPDGIIFAAYIENQDTPSTRANSDTYDISTKYFDTDFYLHMEGTDKQGVLQSSASVYEVPSGYQGSLVPENGQPTLNWFSRDTPHYFWGWTLPWEKPYDPETGEGYNPATATTETLIPIYFPGSNLDETANSNASAWKKADQNGGVEFWRNGKAYEQFIAGIAGPYQYNIAGSYLPMFYRHMVSKIMLNYFYVVDNVTGSSSSNLHGTITFFGLPDVAYFHPCPRKADGTPVQPFVSLPEGWSYPPTESVTYALTNYGQPYLWEGHENTGSYYYLRDAWYIPPEIDFSKISFKIEIYEYNSTTQTWELSVKRGQRGAYYGDFRNVKFNRATAGDGYNDTENPGSDVNILHAGEYLTLTLNLYEKGNPTVQGTIYGWSSGTREAEAHVHQGIYSLEEMKEFSSIMGGSDEEAKRQYYEMNGSARTTEDDPPGEYPEYDKEKKIFDIFDDIGIEGSSTSSSSKAGSYIYVDDDYILDGHGHTINVTSTTMYIGQMRDVYLRYYYSSTEYIIYIDKMGNVWKVDPVTYEETQTPYNVNDPTYNPMKLNMSSGAISKP